MTTDPDRLTPTCRPHSQFDPLSAFHFNPPSPAARFSGGAALIALLPGVGWLLNRGPSNHGSPPNAARSAALAGLARLRKAFLRLGLITAGGMVYYYLPGLIIAYAAWSLRCAPLGLVAGVFLGRDNRDPGLYVSLLPKIRSGGNLQSLSGATPVYARRRRVLARVADNPHGIGYIIRRLPRFRRRFSCDQRVVLAGGGLFFRERIHAAVRAYKQRGRGRSAKGITIWLLSLLFLA